MKKLHLVFLFNIGLVMQAFPALPADSLISRRNELYYQYLDIKNNTETFLMTDCIRLNDVLEQIVISDNHLLDTLSAHDKMLTAFRENYDQINSGFIQSAKDLDDEKAANKYLFITVGALGLLFLVFFILFLVNASSLSKLRKQMKLGSGDMTGNIGGVSEEIVIAESKLRDAEADAERVQKENDLLGSRLREAEAQLVAQADMARKYSDYELKIAQISTKHAEMEKDYAALQLRLHEKDTTLKQESLSRSMIVMENEKLINDLKSEIVNLKGDIIHIEETLMRRDMMIGNLQQELQALQHSAVENGRQSEETPSGETVHDKQAAEVISAKMERLESLRSRNMISELEYQALKQKFLNESA